MIVKEAMDRLNEIIRNSVTYDYCELFVKVSTWENYGKSRTYFSIVEKSTNLKTSKHYVERKYGYIDNKSGEYVPDKNDMRANYTFSGSTF